MELDWNSESAGKVDIFRMVFLYVKADVHRDRVNNNICEGAVAAKKNKKMKMKNSTSDVIIWRLWRASGTLDRDVN